jgi:hypothetical protein
MNKQTLDTELTIYGNTYVTDEDTALQIYKLMGRCLGFTQYSTDILFNLEKFNLQIKPLEKDFEENVNAAKALGISYNGFMEDK